MNHVTRTPAVTLRRTLAVAALALACNAALAAPGAHGPDGQHLDAPAGNAAGAAFPRLEAHSETFELVAELRRGELVILVDRFETNEPVLGATLEVASGELKATARFRAEQGDYLIDDAALLAALALPGEHPLVFTLVAGKEADLLDGTLITTAGGDPAHGHGHDHTLEYLAWAGAVVAGVGLVAGVALWRRRRTLLSTVALGGAK